MKPYLSQNERNPDNIRTIRDSLVGMSAGIHTALPGIIESFDRDNCTVEVSPAIHGKILSPSGIWQDFPLPKLVDVPCVFPHGGGFLFTFDIEKGDECILIFSERNIDAWWQSGAVQPQPDNRMHSIGDAFAIVGIRSQPRKISITPDCAEIRNEAGDKYIRLSNSGITILGDVTVTGDVIADGVSLKNHLTTGVTSGSDLSGPPI